MAQAVKLEDGNSTLVRFLCLHPVTSFSYGIQLLGSSEDAGAGATWHSIYSTDLPSGFTVWSCLVLFWADCVLWSILSWYLNRVIPCAEHGGALLFTFPLKLSYWKNSLGLSTSEEQLAFEYTSTRSEDNDVPSEQVSDMLRQQAENGKSVEIHDLCKVFPTETGSSLVAVDGLNMSLYQGQITCLLGKNGSGKSTTINMLTGSIDPTSGFHVVTGKHSKTHMSEIRQDLGICLQHNYCLFSLLTVREHIDFFGRLKGSYSKMSRKSANEKIDQALQDVMLAEKSDTLANQLSGGHKRKLCLAIAFSGESKLVILDEPTSGMVRFSRESN